MRELLKALSELENQLITTYGISLNEAMVLCSIGSENRGGRNHRRTYGHDSFARIEDHQSD